MRGIGSRVQAAFLEFLSAAARTGIVAPDLARGVAVRRPKRIHPIERFVARWLGLETMPPRQFRNRVAEQGVVAISRKRFSHGMIDRILQVLLEVLEGEP